MAKKNDQFGFNKAVNTDAINKLDLKTLRKLAKILENVKQEVQRLMAKKITNNSIPTKQRIESLKNFASMHQSFKNWLTTCPKKYIWQIIQVTEDSATFTFSLIKEDNDAQYVDLEIILSEALKSRRHSLRDSQASDHTHKRVRKS